MKEYFKKGGTLVPAGNFKMKCTKDHQIVENYSWDQYQLFYLIKRTTNLALL